MVAPQSDSEQQKAERFRSRLWMAIGVLACVALLGLCMTQLPLALVTQWAGLVEPDSSPDTAPLRWLKSGDYAALDRYYSNLQEQFAHGKVTDVELYGDFRELYQNDLANGSHFDQWVQDYPSSYAARLAQGAYYYRTAWAVRGHAFIEQTSPLRVLIMTRYLTKATDVLQRSLAMSPRPYLSSLYLLDIAMMDGTRDQARHWLDFGTSLDPDASLVRLRYMVTLEPRWGGSLEEMRAYAAECQRAGVPAQTLGKLKWNLDDEEIYATARNSSVERRTELFSDLIADTRAAGANPPPIALAGLARIYWDQHRRPDADRLLSQIDSAQVRDAWTLDQMGYVYAGEDRMPQAWQILLKSAQLGDPWAEFIVGKLLVNGCADLRLAPNRVAGLRWIDSSAGQSFPAAVAYLARAQ